MSLIADANEAAARIAAQVTEHNCMVLTLQQCRINANFLATLTPALRHLRSLVLTENPLGVKGAHVLAAYLHTNPTGPLLHLAVDRCRLGVQGVIVLAKGLTTNTSLCVLNVGQNNIRARGLQALGKMLQTNRTLQDLDIHANRITGRALAQLLHVLVRHPRLRKLNCSENRLGYVGLVALLPALPWLHELNLTKCNFTPPHTAMLAHALTQQSFCGLGLNSTLLNTEHGRPRALHHLYLNVTMDFNPPTLSPWLMPSLHSLNLTVVNSAQAVAIVHLLQRNTAVDYLKLHSPTALDDTVGLALATLLTVNTHLRRLLVLNTEFTDVTATALALALQHPTHLTMLQICEHNMAPTGLMRILAALHHNTTLTLLEVSGQPNSWMDMDHDETIPLLQAVIALIATNTTLRDVYFKLIFWMEDDFEAEKVRLVAALQHNTSLVRLDVLDEECIFHSGDDTILMLEADSYIQRNLRRYHRQAWSPPHHLQFDFPMCQWVWTLLCLPYRSPLWALLPNELIYMIAGHLCHGDVYYYPHYAILPSHCQYCD